MTTLFPPELDPIDANRADQSDDAQLALAQSALHAARLAIARWSHGADYPNMQVKAALRLSVQARWYAQTQHGLQNWLDSGGFSAV